MKPVSLVSKAHFLVKPCLYPGALAIDATVGNGYDTLFLAEQVGATGKVFGFDIQQAALDTTRSRLDRANLSEYVTLILASHALMAEKIPVPYHGKISAVMFNLGYLPCGDKTIMTLTDSTLPALNSACQLLSSRGIISVLAYPGHAGGDIETDQVKKWCEQLDRKQFTVVVSPAADNKASAPVLITVHKAARNQMASI
jgi:hypothetical protein